MSVMDFNKSIRYKFFAYISIILFFSTIVSSTVIAVNEGRVLRDALTAEGHNFASFLAKISLDPFIMNDTIQLDSIVNEAKKNKDIYYVVIQDAKGNLVTSQYASINYEAPRLKNILSGLTKQNELKDIVKVIQKNGSITEVSVPITTGGDIIGKVTVCMTTYFINRHMINTVLFVLLLNILGALVLGIVLFFVSKKIVLDPITELAHAAKRLAGGDLSTRLSISATGEMQMLIDSFNSMSEDLQKTTVSREYVNNIIRSMTETLIILSPEHIIIDVNDAAFALLGYEKDELVGHRVSLIIDEDIFHLPSQGAGKELIASCEALCRRKDGQCIPVFFAASCMQNNEGILQGIVCVALDITKLKQAAQELESKNQELEKAYDALKTAQSQIFQQEKMASIGQLAAGVAHEINNPIGFVNSNLTTLKKYVDKLLDFITTQEEILTKSATATDLEQVADKRQKIKLEYITKDITELITQSLDGTKRVRKIVQDLKSFSRLDEAEEKMSDINEGLESTINMVWSELKYKVTLHKELGDIPQIKCYPGRLNQVFMNLLVNAAHAIETQGDITVKTCEDDGYIIISISDTGCGIPQETIRRIFEPFFTTKDVGKGTGLGLSIAYDIIKNHNGEIVVDSQVGQGTTFLVKLPINQ